MPRNEIDYSKTVIYKIFYKDLTIKDEYVGSTTEFSKRKNQHKSDCSNEHRKGYNKLVYKFMRKHGEWDMILPCNNGIEENWNWKLEIGNWKEKLQATLNTRICITLALLCMKGI